MLDRLRYRIGSAIIGKAATTFGLASIGLSKNTGAAFGTGIESAYSNSWVAYSCIRRIAQDIAGLPTVVRSDPVDPESVVSDSHPLVQLINNPNDLFSKNEFIQWIVTMLNLRGSFFIVLNDPLQPTELVQYTDPLYWRPVKEGKDLVGWEYRYASDHIVATTFDVVNHRLINPSDPLTGQSPLQAAATAYQIDMGASTLQADIVARGGERTIMYESSQHLTDPQQAQALAVLRGRRAQNKVGKDVILPPGLKPVSPDFLEEDKKILESQKMQPDKICAVYGLAKSLLGLEDIDKYATFLGRERVYWRNTILPMIRGIESSFDKIFANTVSGSFAGFIRFDLSNVEALREDTETRFKIAGQAHKDGVPWTELNRRFALGLDMDAIPGGDAVLVNSTLAPIEEVIREWKNPAVERAAGEAERKDAMASPADQLTKAELTNELIIRRATDPRNLIRRQLRILRLEKQMRTEWKKLIGGAMKKAERRAGDLDYLRKLKKETVPKMADLAGEFHVKAAEIGALSIVELIEGKIADQDEAMFQKAKSLRPEIRDWLKDRRGLVTEMGEALFNDVLDNVQRVIDADGGQTDLLETIRGRFHSGNGGINKAVTVARTEIGSAVNNARFVEMKAQGFEQHQWLTAADELVRGGGDDEFDHASCDGQVRKIGQKFSCGLEFPMEPGGAPGNVINCRCETIPFVKGGR